MSKGQEAVFVNVARWLCAESGCDCAVQTQQPRGLGESPTRNVFGHLSGKVSKCVGGVEWGLRNMFSLYSCS